jgi:hypothetical protein
MSLLSHPGERTGILQIMGSQSEQKTRDIKAGLGDLPGVYSVDVIGSNVSIRFLPSIVTEQQFYQAIRTAGFQASGFQWAG